ncbi:hypothetical protein GCM10010531_07340 [Blastococcus jejuensis]|uniref:SnoaL-like domain-containing protein n=1 Tax=Blastococcus jejuensis TaxID=351224 RepID=A0ABP6NUH9_9ACTN
MTDHPPTMLHRLQQAIDAHDLDALVALFAADYRNETPVHPARGFAGRDQVRANWTHILAAVPDLRAVLLRWAEGSPEDPALWAEWDWSGNRADGSVLRMRGVTVLGLDRQRHQDVVRWARFYMEPVDDDGSGVAEAVRRTMGAVR